MSTLELKEKLMNEIKGSDNQDLLWEVYRLLELKGEEEDIYVLTPEQEAAINKSRAKVDQGEFLTDEEVNKELDEWLGK